MSQDLVLSSSRSSALTPLNLGLSAVLGPSIATGPSLLADVCARLLWMLFERILQGVEGLARSYLEKFAETRAKMGEEKARVLDEVKAEQDAAEQSKVTEAIKDHHSRSGRPHFGPPDCPMSHGAPWEPPFFVKRWLQRRDQWREWRSSWSNGYNEQNSA